MYRQEFTLASHRTRVVPSSTHRNALTVGRMFGAFCVKHKWLRANPFADVEPEENA